MARWIVLTVVVMLPACINPYSTSDHDAADAGEQCESPETTQHPEAYETVLPNAGACCGPAARLVLNVCTELGPGDGCITRGDVCVQLCDQRQSCAVVEPRINALLGWPSAPDGYCIPCQP